MAFELTVDAALTTTDELTVSVARGADVFVASAETAGVYTLYSSPDGVTWTARQVIDSAVDTPVVWTGSAFFITAYDSSLMLYRMWRSYDGIAWTAVFSDALIWRTITGAGAGYAYFWQDGTYYRTADGVAIAAVSGISTISASLVQFVPGASACVAYSDSNEFFTSADGLAFTGGDTGGINVLSAGWSDSRAEFIRVVEIDFAYVVQYSADGSAWSNFALQGGIELGFTPRVVTSGEFVALVSVVSSEADQRVSIVAPASYTVEGVAFDPLATYPINYLKMFQGELSGEFLFTTFYNSWDPPSLVLGKATFTSAMFWTAFKGQHEV